MATHRYRRSHYLLLAFCALAAPPGARAVHARPGQRPRGAPAIGGSITVRDTAAPDCLDPQKTASGASIAIDGEIVDTLLSADAHGAPHPYLAARYQVGVGGKTITFFLRPGVRFSNGDPLNATAVKVTFDRALNPATKSPVTAGLLSAVTATTVVNATTVRLTLARPYRPLLTNLTQAYTGILDPKAIAAGGDQCLDPIGSGPFKVAHVDPGFSTVTLARNPLYHVAPGWAAHQGPAYLSTIVWKPLVSDATAASELLTGALDVDPSLGGTQLPRVRGNAAIVLHRTREQGEDFLGFNLAHVPFNRPAVRRAVAEAIDRAALVTAAANGQAAPAYSPIPATVPFYDAQSARYAPTLNPTDARRIVAATHVSGSFTLLTFALPEYTTAAELIQAELAQVGLTVHIVSKPVADFIAAAAGGQFDLDLMGWSWPDPDFLYQLFHSSQEKPSGLNFTFAHDRTLDRLIEAGRTAVTTAAARRAYTALQRYMDQQVIVDPLLTDEIVGAARTRVGGWHATTSGLPLFQDLYVAAIGR